MITQLTKNLYNGIINIFSSDNYEPHEQILEPLTCIIKLGILFLKEDGTKLQIIGNSIHYHSPNVFQAPNRWINGDNRNDLHNLSNPIKIALEWHIPQNNKDINNLFQYSIKGLEKLGDSYNINSVSSLIGNTISHYINLIKLCLDNKSLVIKNQINLVDNEQIINNTNEQNSINTSTEKNVYKNIWTNDEISIINKLFEIAIAKKEQNDNYEHYIKSIQSILNDKDDKIRDIIYIKTTKIQNN